MTITEMNKANVERVAESAEAALRIVAKDFGLTLERENGRYDPHAGTFTTKWTFVCSTESGIPTDFSKFAPLYDLTPDDYGRKFNTTTGTYTICGISPRSRKYPILGKCIKTGKTYKFTRTAVAASSENHG